MVLGGSVCLESRLGARILMASLSRAAAGWAFVAVLLLFAVALPALTGCGRVLRAEVN